MRLVSIDTIVSAHENPREIEVELLLIFLTFSSLTLALILTLSDYQGVNVKSRSVNGRSIPIKGRLLMWILYWPSIRPYITHQHLIWLWTKFQSLNPFGMEQMTFEEAQSFEIKMSFKCQTMLFKLSSDISSKQSHFLK